LNNNSKTNFSFIQNSSKIIQEKSLDLLNDPYVKMLKLFYNFQNKESKEIIFKAEKLYCENKEKDIENFKAMYDKITTDYEWELVNEIYSSAGIRYIDINKWQPESPFIRRRKILFPEFKTHDHILFDDSELVLYTSLLESKNLCINFSLVDFGFSDLISMNIKCSINNKKPFLISLTKDNFQYFINNKINKGEHFIKIKVLNPVENQLLKVNMAIADNNDFKQCPLHYIEKKIQRSYNIATKSEPVEFEIKGPAWIRIDELRDDLTFSDYRYLKKGFQIIKLYPKNGYKEALFRIFQKIYKSKSVTKSTRPILAKNNIDSKPLIRINENEIQKPDILYDNFEYGNITNGSHYVIGKFVSRKNIDEDFSLSNNHENYYEFGST